MHIVDTQDIVGMDFLMYKEDSQRLRALIVKHVDYFEGDLARDSSRLKFVSSNKTLDHINNSEEDELIEWMFKEKKVHEGPSSHTYPNKKGSSHNLVIG